MKVERRFGRSLAWLFACVAGMWALVVLAFVLVPDHNPPGQCEGIGFGCSLTPRDGVLLGSVVFGVPISVGTVVIGTFWVAFWHTRWSAVATGLSGFALGLVVSVGLAAGLTAG